MRWRLELGPRPPRDRQAVLPFVERADRLERRFKRAILALTALSIIALTGGTRPGRDAIGSLIGWARLNSTELIGLGPDRATIEAVRRSERQRNEEATRRNLRRFYRGTDPAMRRLFDVARMSPDVAVIGSGRVDNAFVLSSDVFEADEHGRSYKLRPSTRSVWLRRITLRDGPFGLFLVPDTPEVRAATGGVGGLVVEESVQTTNSWGCRGPEPLLDAPVRGLVVGDSFMMGTFVGDDDTPPTRLQRVLARVWERPVSILNTGHLGYAPEQYYHTLKSLGDRFRPHFVVVSVFANDFGDEHQVLRGGGDDWDEAAHWLGEINQWCRSRQVPCLLVPVPCDLQVNGPRRDGHYPGRVSNLYQGAGSSYLDPLDAFINEHLRLSRSRAIGLYNTQVGDGHFSPRGAALWAELVGRRLVLMTKGRAGFPPTNARVE